MLPKPTASSCTPRGQSSQSSSSAATLHLSASRTAVQALSVGPPPDARGALAQAQGCRTRWQRQPTGWCAQASALSDCPCSPRRRGGQCCDSSLQRLLAKAFSKAWHSTCREVCQAWASSLGMPSSGLAACASQGGSSGDHHQSSDVEMDIDSLSTGLARILLKGDQYTAPARTHCVELLEDWAWNPQPGFDTTKRAPARSECLLCKNFCV